MKSGEAAGLVEQIRAAIRASGLSLNRLAQASGVDTGQLSRFMRGERNITVASAERVCTALGLRLVGGDAPPPAKKRQKGRTSGGAGC
jgi:transcriptional regulator with XRE-family HTH domain